VRMLTANYRPGLEYHKADVLLYDFVPESGLQTDLLGTVDLATDAKSHAKMQALDAINRRHGKGKLKFAAEALSASWQPRKKLMSPRYTSAWPDLPEVKLYN
jgi:DNA polymerase V